MTRNTLGKVVDKKQMLARVAEARATGKIIVHCHGCFDIVHPGHLRYLEFARTQGDILLVSLTGDSQITKGDQRPYLPQELRAENLAALQIVDLVYINPYPTAAELLNELCPEVYVKGSEYEQSKDAGFIQERSIVVGYGGRVVFSSGDVVFSSSRLLEILGKDSTLESETLALVCRRNGIDRGSMSSLVDSFSRLNVLVVGDLILDRYVLCDATDLASEAPMMSLTRLEERRYVGGAAIVARHIAGLGAKSYLLSAAADDQGSCYSKKVLDDEHVVNRLISCRPRLPEKTRYLVDTTKVMRIEDAHSHPLDSDAEEEALAWIQMIEPKLDAVIFCDFGYGTISSRLLAGVQKMLNGRLVAADVSGQRSRLLQFKHVDLLCPTERELRSALHDFDRGLSSVAWDTMNATQARRLMITLGKKGLVLFDRQSSDNTSDEWKGRLRSEYLPSLADKVVDPLGCGDAMLAATTLGLTAGGSFLQSAYLGSAAAAIEIARIGNEPIDHYTIKRWMSGRIELAEAQVASKATPGETIRIPPKQLLRT